MIDAQQARHIAQGWIDANVQLPGDEALIDDVSTLEEDFGWIFFYNSRRFIETRRLLDGLVGNAPIIVKRDSGEVLVTGTAKPIEEYVAELRTQGHL